jgi:hypothetical protein
MNENLISKIARMLGVELGEEFKVKGNDAYTYKFTNDGLKLTYANDIEMSPIATNKALVALLNGDAEIIKLPWKQKKGDTYYSFEMLGNAWVVASSWWGGFPSEYALLDKGWVYRTCEEAQAALPSVAKELGVEYKL